ncbi:DUF7108 domain-containing protein [Haloarchaeobius sp. DFWS5]|uniref:DUF7108 domain-containing protein n=1 Tax=Haloarchaeobius sp. DFWS5 TaxID=3446114 RepID=UPI003EBFF087
MPEERDGTAETDVTEESPGEEPGEPESELPTEVVDAAERLTRLATEAVDESEADAYRERRDDLLADHEFVARVRDDDASETLVLHPDEWVGDGVIRTDRIEDTDRAVEVHLSGPGDAEEWQDVDDHNRALVESVREAHGAVHAGNADRLADFMSNHYARKMDTATADELREFRDAYYPVNTWPTAEEKAVVETSLRLVFETAEKRMPGL